MALLPPELLPCVRCGSRGKVDVWEGEPIPYTRVFCTNTECLIESPYGSRQFVVSWWNYRPAQ